MQSAFGDAGGLFKARQLGLLVQYCAYVLVLCVPCVCACVRTLCVCAAFEELADFDFCATTIDHRFEFASVDRLKREDLDRFEELHTQLLSVLGEQYLMHDEWDVAVSGPLKRREHDLRS